MKYRILPGITVGLSGEKWPSASISDRREQNGRFMDSKNALNSATSWGVSSSAKTNLFFI